MKFRVVLDYGHGGSKPGAVYEGVEEKTVNLLTGQKIFEALHKDETGNNKIQVMLTRDADYNIPISVRYKLINAHDSDENPVHLVVSIHYNAFANSSVRGFEVYYAEKSTNGKKAAQAILNKIREGGLTVKGNGMITTKRLGRKLAMIHKTDPPSVLIEIGYLTNPVDRRNAEDPSFRLKVADKISEGIWAYLKGEAGHAN